MGMGRGEERVRCMERVTWKFTFQYVKQVPNGNFLYVLGNSNSGSVSTQRGGWDGERDEREVQKGEDICIPMAESC